jgi:hypothetical protein
MAFYEHRHHPDVATVNFLGSIGGVQLNDCSDLHSVWSLYGRKIYILLTENVVCMEDVINVFYRQARLEGVGYGKQEALTIINQHLSNLIFR